MIEKLPLLLWPRRQILTTLIFHRVLPKLDPLRHGEPDLERFDALMKFISNNFNVLPLPEAVDQLQRGKLPRRACCITFDDGYADNLTIALPILEKYRLPATVFVATGYLDGGRMFNDAVIDAVAQSPLPSLDLKCIGLGEYPLERVEQKQSAIASILNHIKYSETALRNQQVNTILANAACGVLPNDIMLTSTQLRELSDRGIEIGGHTVDHNILTALKDDEVMAALVSGRKHLEKITGKAVTSFAYPNGKPGQDYGERHVLMVEQAGFSRAVTTARGVGNPSSNVFQLPRFTPWGASLIEKSTQLLRNAWSSCKG
jgi:peptidoglycan/xylan/chitin deacetylase (PgdA/CDA1 family)